MGNKFFKPFVTQLGLANLFEFLPKFDNECLAQFVEGVFSFFFGVCFGEIKLSYAGH